MAQNGSTNDSTPQIQGTGEANGDIITVYNGDEVLGSAVVGADGSWTFTPDALADGTYDITVTETDAAGNVSDPSNAYDFTINTVAPEAPVITDVVDDSGEQNVDVAPNGATNDNTPQIQGTGNAEGDVITVYNGSHVLGSAVVGADGSWTFTPDALADGLYDITVTETDAAGNVSDPSAAYDFTIDTVAPAAPVITDVVDDSSEQPVDVAQNGFTNDTTPQIQGTGNAEGDIITVYNGSEVLGSAVVGADGSWTFTPDALADGQYDITVTETDAAGNESVPSNAYDFTVDTVAPAAPVITDVVDDSSAQPVDVAPNGSTNDTTPQIQGTGNAEGDIITVYNGDEVLGSAVVGADGSWTFTPDALADGLYDITVTETDAAGNESAPSNAYDFTVNTVAPVAPVITDVVDDSGEQNVDVAQNGSTSDTTPQIQGTGDAEGDIITVYNNGSAIGSAVVGADGTWTFTPDALADGQYDITVTETDAAGNVSEASNAYDFTVDTVAPVAPVITDVVDDSAGQPVDVAQNGSTNDTTPQIQGTGEAEGDIITVYNGSEVLGSAMVGADGTWTFTPDALADGKYDITVTETDAAGNVSDPSNAYDFTIDTVAPVTPVITDVVDDSGEQNVDVAPNGSTNDTTPQIQGTGEAEGDIITVYNGDEVLGSAVVGADGTWTFTPDALADGQYDITVTETDAAGNESAPSNAYDFTVNTVAPVTPVITDVVDDSGEQNVDVAP
ncbi:Ig-like domain-containing protein, partial [Rahnella woolbedingensis]|uniref:Ig-like domain-containing protein n=1 Tax=Rahnella woolbedingensis TaxID=1510574 RepID=UPI001FC8EDFB